MNTGSMPPPPNTTVGDLGQFDVQAVLGVLREAPQTLHINNPTERYIIIEFGKDGSLTLQIHVSDGTDSGYIMLAADGTVQKTYPAGS